MLGRNTNMNPGRFFMPRMGFGAIPSMGMNMAPAFRMGSSIPAMNGLGMVPKSSGIFGKIGSGLKAFNWSGLLTGANKTLNVVNQTIPLIRQAKPMVNNMRSMFKLAKAFGNETVSRGNRSNSNSNARNRVTEKKEIKDDVVNNNYDNRDSSNSNYPIFFI